MAADQPRSLAVMLKERRAQLGLTQQQAAKVIGVTDRGYRNWERNNGEPAIPQGANRKQIARFLGLPFTEVANVINSEDLAETEARMLELVRQVVREETQSSTDSS